LCCEQWKYLVAKTIIIAPELYVQEDKIGFRMVVQRLEGLGGVVTSIYGTGLKMEFKWRVGISAKKRPLVWTIRFTYLIIND
jgi:hypothetical protein